MVAGTAHAASISVTDFTVADYQAATSAIGTTIENFEGFAAPTIAPLIDTVVGDFTAAGGIGSGDTCDVIQGGGDCVDIAVTDITVNGQSGPIENQWLNSLDTIGVHWDAKNDNGESFNRVVFGIVDAADIGDIVLTISVEGHTEFATIGPGAGDGNAKLVVIDFEDYVSEVKISMVNSSNTPDDAFAIDGAALSQVPLPATGLLLLGGMGAIGMMRRRKKA